MNTSLSRVPEAASRLSSDIAGRADQAWSGAQRLAATGIDRARYAADEAAHRASDLGHATMDRVRNEPVKAVMMGAAIGAVAVLLLRWLSPPR